MSNTPFSIEASPVGGTVTVAGEDVSERVSALSVVMGAQTPTVLTLEMRPGVGRIEGEGIVQVSSGTDGEAVAEWLEGIDPGQLQRDALALGPAALASGMAPALLQALAAYARGT